jgi:fatty-acyl-CoA synthase
VSATDTFRMEQSRASANKAWLRALELTASIARHPGRILPTVLEEVAAEVGDKPALLSDRESLTHSGLVQRSNQYARWALNQGLAQGDTVCLFMPNCPEYLAAWLGITKIGGVVALLNTHLSGASLAHSINIVAAKQIIVAAELLEPFTTAVAGLHSGSTVWTHGGDGFLPRIDRDLEFYPGEPLRGEERRPVTINDRALYIYTSGTTGLPKAASVSHGRLMEWTHWFAGMMDTRPTDRMYSCLPMYHASGGVQAPGAVLVRGGSVVLRDHFSAGKFWTDVARWDCTLFQYIGELCRYLLLSESSPHEARHRIRAACGNGLRPEIWNEFQSRFQIPWILEFYAATEGCVSLFNVEGEPGAIGRIPSYLGHRSSVVLIKIDPENQVPLLDEHGFCIPCATHEAGEAIGPLPGASHVATRFEGYTDKEASEKKVIRNVFKSGDVWFRTGDLMTRDERGFFYFIDRVGDTFRWKGENVATSEVAGVMATFPGIRHANVYGVAIPGTDGRAGMAALSVEGELDLFALRAYLVRSLPAYARPVFLRIRNEMESTPTFKYTKTHLVEQGFDPRLSDDPICFNHPLNEAFVWLDDELYDRILSGHIRL